jgi:hypothetical protein
MLKIFNFLLFLMAFLISYEYESGALTGFTTISSIHEGCAPTGFTIIGSILGPF